MTTALWPSDALAVTSARTATGGVSGRQTNPAADATAAEAQATTSIDPARATASGAPTVTAVPLRHAQAQTGQRVTRRPALAVAMTVRTGKPLPLKKSRALGS